MRRQMLSICLGMLGLINIIFAAPPILAGYVEGWTPNPPPASDVAQAGYTHVMVAFGVFSTASPGTIDLQGMSGFDLTSYITLLHQNGIKVLLSLGGASTNITNTTVDFDQDVSLASSPLLFETAFVSSMKSLVDQYGFDGFDIDIEHGLNASYSFTNPSARCDTQTMDSHCDLAYLSDIINHFVTTPGYTTQLISFAPQIANIAATSGYSNVWGN